MTENWVDLEHEFDLVIDYDASLWLEIPPRWDEESWSDIDSWASECAELLWRSHAQDPGESGIPFLAGTLRRCADAFAPERFDTRALLHIASPTSTPLPVFAAVRPAEAEEEGEREAALRALVQADDPDAVEPPVVETFHTENLGEGVRALRYVRQDDAPEVLAWLRYAWHDGEIDTDTVLWTATDDVGQVIQAAKDIEKLAHKIQIRIWDVDPED
ncbi:hypothetical protein [Streptomyces sp. TRM68367]|uniref:hypothetical protein n=1 Tax=Streptomyces sp. TRM68367 TaxID=2758415 RepID=UPI00165C86EA|nr:hypothetical protein [Streptomyces sp. TRM68367]MBC9728831.1 hypothetical protein [Streptomyces sp. TRM68367]